ncbi:hypothetical protein N7468_008735 [Penicillium chermesinum]|uniref:Zn(2)-C6 fungal-type domain-containing protein n=1 Tax=Penicillium chermesinum TaxID=63820 RepID=A0A9W9TED4_9EURO|nr:uncharacterized protein N7468_008735 [Penicillium chermesinum]KAJ5219531.1 hypothetical protein N7468_008735 [Penicillium chermesinum]
MQEASSTSATNWRIPKACQECRKRKIRCNGANPCKTCHQRNTPCIYRDYTRHRRKKHEISDSRRDERDVRSSPESGGLPRPQGASLIQNYPNSVSATHMASPSCQVQLYYGPTSHFSLMQHVYRDLVANPSAPSRPANDIEEAGAGLDLFSFRRIFFGIPESHETGRSTASGDMALMFLPYGLANTLLSGFLSTLYILMPFQPPNKLQAWLEQLYSHSPSAHPDTLTQAIILIILGIASIGTEHDTWADLLYDRTKALMVPFDDVVNIQTVQISLLMISLSFPAPFDNKLTASVDQIRRFYTSERHPGKHWQLVCIRKSLGMKSKHQRSSKNGE